MLKVISILLLFATPFVLSGCAKNAESSIVVNGNFEVERLFTNEGCTMYRFYDNGSYHYYASCKAGDSEVIERHSRSCGKGCTRHDDASIATLKQERVGESN